MQKKEYIRIILNLFDGSGASAAADGAEGGGDGENHSSVDPAVLRRGKELNLSDDLMEDYAKAYGRKGAEEENKEDNSEEQGQENEGEDLDAEFDELINGKYKDAFHKRVGKDVKDRVDRANRDKAELETKVSKLSRISELLTSKYGTDDPDAIYEAVKGDDDFWRQVALNSGKSVENIISDIDTEHAKQAQQAELENLRRYKETNELNMRLQSLAQQTKEVYPDFDLVSEFENPRFRQALDFIAAQNDRQNKENGTSKEIFDVTYAYELAHADELRENTIRRAAKAAAGATMHNIQANRNRAVENATKRTAPQQQKSYDDMSDEEFAKELERVRRGEGRIHKF